MAAKYRWISPDCSGLEHSPNDAAKGHRDNHLCIRYLAFPRRGIFHGGTPLRRVTTAIAAVRSL